MPEVSDLSRLSPSTCMAGEGGVPLNSRLTSPKQRGRSSSGRSNSPKRHNTGSMLLGRVVATTTPPWRLVAVH